jgi:DNA-binding transcriptional LysR family regulator
MSQPKFPTARHAAAALRRMTMAEARTLLAIKSAGNLSRAAIELGVSQPALSQHIRELESKLDVALFLRHRRGLDPTPYGLVLLRLAAAMYTDLSIAAEELVMAASEAVRPIRVGSMALTSGGLLAVALGRFASEQSNPATVLVEGPREMLIEDLRHNRIDVFVGRLADDAATTTGLVSETLFQDGVVVIAAARHPLGKRTRLAMKALLSYGWVLPAEHTSFREQIAGSMRQAGLTLPSARIASYSMLAIPAIVGTSDLLGLLPTSLFASGTLSGSVQGLPVNADWIPAPVGFVVRHPAQVERLEGLLKTLRAVAASARGAIS